MYVPERCTTCEKFLRQPTCAALRNFEQAQQNYEAFKESI
jgi:hypothetical protein